MNALVAIGTCSTVFSEMTVLLTCYALNAILLDMSIALTLEAVYVSGVDFPRLFRLLILLIRFTVLFWF